MNILIVNGPNLNLLGLREPEVYGRLTYVDLIETLHTFAKAHGVQIEIHQSNHEGVLLDLLQSQFARFQGIVINPGALTHYSYALYDCLKALPIPAVEVHLSDIMNREPFRKLSVTKAACIAQISGKGFQSYTEAITLLLERNKQP